ncbi:MAG TPA: GNAT family N-acetyltransferase [Afifellaceae bacterium]|nr:GNAT family N-acetyltransferase [Afifellaceae bacterium]
MFLENVAVRDASSGRGLGSKLIHFCEAEARRLGLSAVELYTNVKMTGNLSLYPHLGYAEFDRREEDGFERVYFRKILN